jgi:hypothetical protein
MRPTPAQVSLEDILNSLLRGSGYMSEFSNLSADPQLMVAVTCRFVKSLFASSGWTL